MACRPIIPKCEKIKEPTVNRILVPWKLDERLQNRRKRKSMSFKKNITFLFEEKLYHVRNFNTTNKNYTTIIFFKARYFFNKLIIITFKLFDPRVMQHHIWKRNVVNRVIKIIENHNLPSRALWKWRTRITMINPNVFLTSAPRIESVSITWWNLIILNYIETQHTSERNIYHHLHLRFTLIHSLKLRSQNFISTIE